jgi:hypothetical protein
MQDGRQTDEAAEGVLSHNQQQPRKKVLDPQSCAVGLPESGDGSGSFVALSYCVARGTLQLDMGGQSSSIPLGFHFVRRGSGTPWAGAASRQHTHINDATSNNILIIYYDASLMHSKLFLCVPNFAFLTLFANVANARGCGFRVAVAQACVRYCGTDPGTSIAVQPMTCMSAMITIASPEMHSAAECR